MLLSDMELRGEVDAGRLVFEPDLPDVAFQSASVDLGLHSVFWRAKVPTGPGINLKRAHRSIQTDPLPRLPARPADER